MTPLLAIAPFMAERIFGCLVMAVVVVVAVIGDKPWIGKP